MLVQLHAAERKPSRERDAVAFGLVIDRSGSMHGAPLNRAKDAAVQVIQNLRQGDKLAVTIFDDVAEVPATCGIPVA